MCGSQSDKITLKQIKQIPGCTGLMGVLDYKAAGEVWEEDEIKAYIDEVHARRGLECEVIESVNVHEDIGSACLRDMYIENYCKSIRNLAKYGVKVIVTTSCRCWTGCAPIWRASSRRTAPTACITTRPSWARDPDGDRPPHGRKFQQLTLPGWEPARLVELEHAGTLQERGR